MQLAGSAPVDFVRGDGSGLLLPAHGGALRAGGEAFLTEAFRLFGALPPTNRVLRITNWEKCPGGSTGEKFYLSVAYERPDPHLHCDLFVKFSRDFNDPIRDNRGKYEMESEVRFATISRLPSFPINVPAAYFADYQRESSAGILITERINFGRGKIEPHQPKCRDYELSDPFAHYRAIVKALAWIAASHRSGRLSPDIDTLFPFDPEEAAGANPISLDEEQLRNRVAQYADFAARFPHLLPANITSASFIEKLKREVGRFREHESTIKRFLHGNPDFIALCHWNANIDNAWFWREESDALQCGLMDWGHVNQMNVAFSLWGCLSGASYELWDQHLDELLALFATELEAHDGPRLDVQELKLHLQLHVAMMGLAYFIESPSRILHRFPEIGAASGPNDPLLWRSETARNQLSMLTVFLNLWDRHDLGAILDRLLERVSR